MIMKTTCFNAGEEKYVSFVFAVEQSIKNFACWLSPGIQKVKYELHGQIVLIFCSLT